MDQGRITVSYAKALLDWANDNNLAEEVYAQTHCLLSFIRANPEFYLLLHSPMASLIKKIGAIKNVLLSCSPHLSNFVSLLVKNHREKQLIGTLLIYQSHYRKQRGIVKVMVESAVEMNDSYRQQIQNFLKNKFGGEIEQEFHQNPNLIGGFILTIDDQMLDKSVKGEIEKLRRKLIGIEN
jgi:F-type H+-transporting ATPase subunit delta